MLSVCIWAVPLVAAFVVVRHNAIARLILGGSILLIGIVTYAYSLHPVMATAMPEFVREACRAWVAQQ